jgi:hypothetical protein
VQHRSSAPDDLQEPRRRDETRRTVDPGHSSRARNERFREGEVFRRVFERVVETCIAAGLVGGEGFAVDASLIQADANKRARIGTGIAIRRGRAAQ